MTQLRPDAPEAGAPIGPVRHPVVVTGLLLIGVQLCFRAWALSHSWFYTDDYLRLRDALEARFGLDYLLTPDNGHLMPATRAVYYAFAQSLGLDWTAAMIVALVLQALASLAALWMLVTLFGPRWGVLAPLVLYLSSAMTAQASLWWISALNQTPVQMCFFLAVGCWVLHLRSRGWLPLIGLMLTIAWGLLFFQKVLFVLPVLVLLGLMYFCTGGPLTRVRSLVTRYWVSALVIGLVAGGYTAYYVAVVPPARNGSLDTAWVELAGSMVNTFATGVTGGPWEWVDRSGGAWADPPGWFVVLAWGLLAAIVIASVVLRRRAARAWVLLAVYYVLLVGSIGFTRATVFGAEIGTAFRLQTDGLCAAVLSVALAWLPLQGAAQSSEPRTISALAGHQRRNRPVGKLALVLGIAVSLLVAALGTFSWVRYVDSWTRINDGRDFVERLGAESDRLSGVEVVDREMPESVLDDLTRPNNKLSDIADLLAPGFRFPTYSGRLTVVTDRGTVNQALILRQTRSLPGPIPDCGWSVEHGARVRVPVRAEVPFEPLWVRIGYYIQDPGEVTIQLGDQRVETPVGSGPNSLYIRVTEGFDDVRFSGLTSRGAMCVNIVEVGRPVPGPQL